MRSKCRCSMCPAIHINSRSWLRSSSTHEPSDPPPKVVSFRSVFTIDSLQRLASFREVFANQIMRRVTRKISKGGGTRMGGRAQGSLNLCQKVHLLLPTPETRVSGITHTEPGQRGEVGRNSFPCRICRQPGTQKRRSCGHKISLRPGPTSRQARYPKVTVFRTAGRPWFSNRPLEDDPS